MIELSNSQTLILAGVMMLSLIVLMWIYHLFYPLNEEAKPL